MKRFELPAIRRKRDWRDHVTAAGKDLPHAFGVLVEEPPAVWALAQDYVGPDGVFRTRSGVLASLRVEPYERRSSCRTSARTPGRRRGGFACSARRTS